MTDRPAPPPYVPRKDLIGHIEAGQKPLSRPGQPSVVDQLRSDLRAVTAVANDMRIENGRLRHKIEVLKAELAREKHAEVHIIQEFRRRFRGRG